MMQFIPPSIVIERIREIVPSFSDRVAGAGQFEAIGDIQECPSPSCFVLLSDNTADTISMQTSLQQNVFHGFDVLLVLEAIDRRKQEAEEVSIMFKAMILNALNGWKPSDEIYDSSDPLKFIGDSYVSTDRSRYVRVFKFIQDYYWDGNSGEGEGPHELGIFDKFFADLVLEDSSESTLPIQMQATDIYDQ